MFSIRTPLIKNGIEFLKCNQIKETMTSVISNNPNLKYQKYGCRNIGIRKLGFVAMTQFLCVPHNCA